MKKIIALLLAACMVFTLAACGGDSDSDSESDSESASTDAESWTIGYNIWGSGDPIFDTMVSEMEYTFDALGVDYNYASDNYTTDTSLQNVQNFVSAGVDGMVLQANDDSVLLNMAQTADDGEIPFVLSIFVGEDEAREEIADTMEYYIGSVQADLYTDGYLMGQAAIEDGMTTVVMIGGNVGDYHFDIRIEGFTQAFVTEGGGTIIDEARCSSPSEATEKANALLSANSDVDCVFVMVGSYVSGTVSAMDQLGLEIPLYVSNGDEETAELILDGVVNASCGGNDLAECVAIALMVNYLDGYQILDEDGNVPELAIIPFAVTADNAETYLDVFFGDDDAHPFTEELLQSLTYRYNSDVTYDDFVDLVTNQVTLEALAEANGK